MLAKIMAVYMVNDHHNHACLRVHVVVEVCHHRGIFVPPMHDVEMMTVDLAMEGLSNFSHTLILYSD